MLLSDLGEEERKEALDYYEEYFLEAGEGKEADVIRELGSPNEVAYKIREELSDKNLAPIEETSYEEDNVQERSSKKPMNFWKIGCIVLACIIFGPVVIPTVLGLLGGLLGILVAAVAVVLALGVAAIAIMVVFAIVAVVLFVYGIVKLVVSPITAILLLGGSLIALAIFILLVFAAIKLCVNVLPSVWGWLVDGVVGIYHWGKGKVGGYLNGRK